MTYIVCEPCIGTKDRACVEVCPVECFYEGTDQLYIHPEECIDCAACEPVCPVTAIFPEDSVPDQWKSYIQKNYKFIEERPDAPHALTKTMRGEQDNFAHTFTVEGKTITLPPPPAGFGGPAPPPPKAEAPAPPKPKPAPPAPPKAPEAPKAPAPPAAPARTPAAAPDAISQIAEAAAAAAEAAARAAEAAAAAIRMLQGKADGRTVYGAPSAPAAQPQPAPPAKAAEARAIPKAEAPAAPSPAAAPAPAQRQAGAPPRVGPDPSFERGKQILYALIDFESGARKADPGELARAEETATALFDEIAKAVGNRDYTLEDIEKKDVALRQKMELANAIVDRVGRIRLQMEIDRQRGRTRAQIPGALASFAIAGACSALGLLYAWRYSFSAAGTPSLHDFLSAPFTPEGFMPFLGFNLLAGLFGLFGLLALFKLARSWVEVCHLEALRPKEFGAASLRPRRWSWIYRLKIESQRLLEAERMLQSLAAKKR
jgi:NAD-dependent dihydropyrimidine dehydrogenase PreA subunit